MTPEEIIEAGQKALDWMLEHKITVVLTVIFVSAITIVTVTYVDKREKEYEAAWAKIGALALDTSVAKFQDESAEKQTFTSAIEQYKFLLEQGTAPKKTRPWIVFELGNAQYGAKEYADAAETYKQFLGSYGDHPLAPLVRQSLGYACEENGRLDEAVVYLNGNAPADGPSLLAQEKWDLGRCYEKLGRKEEAVKVYGEAVKLAPDSWPAKLAQFRLENMQ
ncbi:MAG: tetratricopeptide repeat protein [Candidatus Brocadiales bacterium]|nr:tetratricopeptide repeat protein [Candidatus Bathyanammoxibius sp.]MCQ4574007.1 tetratricopeptide repeat protein [Candidatus Bathyanammoxibius amoris]